MSQVRSPAPRRPLGHAGRQGCDLTAHCPSTLGVLRDVDTARRRADIELRCRQQCCPCLLSVEGRIQLRILLAAACRHVMSIVGQAGSRPIRFMRKK